MARKPKKKNRTARLTGWWLSIQPDRRKRILLVAGGSALALTIVAAASSVMGRLDRHVRSLIHDEFPDARVNYVNLPESMQALARNDLDQSVDDLLRRPWTDDALCRAMVHRIEQVGWVRRVGFVRRTPSGQFDIGAEYRRPFAMVQQDTVFNLVDVHGVRLPGSYRYDPRWSLVQGVAAQAPPPGSAWPGDDLRAGLAVLERIKIEPFAGQITAVLVDNFGGRIDVRSNHIALATDRAGGRIEWGSAPGREVEENDVEQKITLLRANFRETGRADAHHAVIDVSTYPDRFTIPG